MALIVLGNPITEETLKGMPEYRNKTTITRTDKARMALIMKDVAEAQALKCVENLKKEDCDRGTVTTIGKIYNATGGTMKFSVKHDFSGKIGTCPVKIENGQFGVFKQTGKDGSCGAVVYWGTNKNGKACDWMFSWSHPTNEDDKVFTEIAEHGHYKSNPNDPIWDHVHEDLINSGTTSTCEWEGCHSYMATNRSDVENRVVVAATATLDMPTPKA
ncbi:unnamed protein product [Camellia sinensis]|uniref:Jasmonate-inducible protein 1 n=1 Tax=Camellia sinensis var. sinensis TaxID=542762 RepID=A0A1P8YYH8_CAMSN|nr:jasmonate-inducible protein 1 [Camellia sinensis var. sinensis]